jgi:hypothetical protein
MKKKTIDEIDESFKASFEKEINKLRERLSKIENRKKFSEYEKEFKSKLRLLVLKREKEFKNYLIQNKNSLFEIDEEKKEKKKEGDKVLDVKHLDLSWSKKDEFKKRFKIFIFRSKLIIKKTYYSLLPNFLVFWLFKLKFSLRNSSKDLFLKIGNIFKRIKKRIGRFFKRIFEKLNKIYENIKKVLNQFLVFLKKLFKKIKEKFVNKKEEGKEGEEKKEGENQEEKEKSSESEEESSESEEEKDKKE